MVLYIVKDGIENIASVLSPNGIRILGTNYYAITYDFESNEGYIELKKKNYLKLYTQIGQKVGQKRYYEETTFEACILKLKELKGNDQVIICDSSEIEKYK
ncbi:hypothetical protein QYR09_08100 [Cellulophaga lytica]|nr:hypothetical protein QYR09_08100 [Cellulophaga lytica]